MALWKEQDYNLRMLRFWEAYEGEIPSSLIFGMWQQKMDVHGLLWAPSTFMAPLGDTLTGGRFNTDQYHCRRNADGLSVVCSGIMLPQAFFNKIMGVHMFFVQDLSTTTQRRYLVILDRYVRYQGSGECSSATVGSGGYPATAHKMLPRPPGGPKEPQDLSNQQPCLILREPIEELDRMAGKAAVHVVVVNMYRRDNENQLYCQYVAAGILKTEEEGKAEFPKRGYKMASPDDGRILFEYNADHETPETLWLEHNQVWYVG